ncbi:MAG: hypothetical protein JNM84_25785 [Planctomycetes bacterium]|nr:hypothetical protein [Planctomycetota bacterium]
MLRRSIRSALLLPALCAAVGLVPAADAEAQGRGAAMYEDPYTLGDAKALEQAGYVKIGSAELAPGISSSQIEHALALEQRICWIETAHFKLGIELPATKAALQEKKGLEEELERLKKRLPRVRTSGVVDGWTRAHLCAMRAEEHYADFVKRFAIDEQALKPDARYLGMKSKYAILLFTKESSLGTFAQTFLKRDVKAALQHYLDSGCMLYVDALEVHKPEHRLDLGVRARLAYNVASNLVDGYGGFFTHTPPWWREGFAQVVARGVNGQYAPMFDPRMYENDQKQAWEWAPRVSGRAKHNIAKSAAALFAVQKSQDLDFASTMDSWSRVEFLLAQPGDGARKFLDALQQIDALRLEEGERVAKQAAALEASFGFDPAGFDQKWRSWVLETYPKR